MKRFIYNDRRQHRVLTFRGVHMANDEHVALLKQGVAAWNAWRDKKPHIRSPDLSGAVLNRAELSGADFRSARL
jgi:uncharacterized protein YjbI with pentapeptide repeats